MTPEREAMIAAMRADPTNAALMCITADLLDEEGDPHRAEALRWLGERGMVGAKDDTGYYGASDLAYDPIRLAGGCVSDDWWFLFTPAVGRNVWDAVDNRLDLMDAYHAADEETRARWLRETEEALKRNLEEATA